MNLSETHPQDSICFIHSRWHRWFGWGLPLLWAVCFAVSCEQLDSYSKPYVASVNGSKIYLDDYQRELARKRHLVPEDFLSRPEGMKKFEEEVLEGMIAEKIMLLRAKELNITVSDSAVEEKISEMKKDYGDDFTNLFAREKISYEIWKEWLKKEMILQSLVDVDVNSKIKITDTEAEDYFKRHQDNYKTEARVRVSQIVVNDMELAKKALKRLAAGEEFAKVAADMSIAPEAKQGGDLGFITRWMMPEPLDKTIFKMRAGTVSRIVKSSYGYHIFKVLENQPARSRSFQEVREQVLADLRLQKEDDAFVSWLEGLKKKAVVKKKYKIQSNAVMR
ncbi:MAG TPA: peptidyl-prolyl cis-trans isomerase [Smithella sp.]|nr:peptidyl-prolyl cis-trans isomerase [Smithella sp.]